MGSDRAPKPEVEGAIQAVRLGLAKVILVGPEAQLRDELALHPSAAKLPIEIVNATQVITMDEKAATAVRSKRDSTMRVGLRLVREGRAVGFVSAGNTGAMMATAKMVLGTLPGVDRPAIAAVFPTQAGTVSVMVDVGANVDCQAAQPGTVRGHGRDLLASDIRNQKAARRIAFRRRRREQGQRAHARSFSRYSKRSL